MEGGGAGPFGGQQSEKKKSERHVPLASRPIVDWCTADVMKGGVTCKLVSRSARRNGWARAKIPYLSTVNSIGKRPSQRHG